MSNRSKPHADAVGHAAWGACSLAINRGLRDAPVLRFAGTLLARRLSGHDVIVASGWHFVIAGAPWPR